MGYSEALSGMTSPARFGAAAVRSANGPPHHHCSFTQLFSPETFREMADGAAKIHLDQAVEIDWSLALRLNFNKLTD